MLRFDSRIPPARDCRTATRTVHAAHGSTAARLVPLVVLAALAGCADSAPLDPDRTASSAFDRAGQTAVAAARAETETADIVGQGPTGSVVAADGATLRRTPNGISVQVRMPTPEPGSYTYPSGPDGGAWTDEEGTPEVFSLWCFVFDPDHDPFNPPTQTWTGVFAAAGHAVAGSTLTLSGHVSTSSEPFLGEALDNPESAAVMLAVAPHGALTAEHLPDALRTPTQPGPDIWWIATFD